MAEMLTIRDTANRAKAEGLPISENALRNWVKQGKVPAVLAGKKQLIYYPNLIRFLTCSASGPADPSQVAASNWRE